MRYLKLIACGYCILLSSCFTTHKNVSTVEMCDEIAELRMESNSSIIMLLLDSHLGEAMIYQPNNPEYTKLLSYINGLEVGDNKLVKLLSNKTIDYTADLSSIQMCRVIGDAIMSDEQTIILNLYPQLGSGQAIIKYEINHPYYQKVLNHLNGLSVGERKLVRAFPENW